MSQTPLKKIAVLMTCHNRREKTLDCLRALYASRLLQDHSFTAYLVDDGSTDGTTEAVSREFPRVRLIPADGSLFWNNGMRLAHEIADEDQPDFYLWLNDDTLVFPDTLERLLEAYDMVSRTQRLGPIICGATQDPETKRLTYGGVARDSRWHPLKLRMLQPLDHPIRCDTFFGNCVLVPADTARSLTNLDPAFSHSLGDIDYGFRARESGSSVWMAPGYAGTCSRNPREGTWKEHGAPLRQRWQRVKSAKGLPPREWRVIMRRHGGPLWPLLWTLPYLKLPLHALRFRRAEV